MRALVAMAVYLMACFAVVGMLSAALTWVTWWPWLVIPGLIFIVAVGLLMSIWALEL